MKRCEDCKWNGGKIRPNGEPTTDDVCHHPEISPENCGRSWYCRNERGHYTIGLCRYEGRLWEPRAAEAPAAPAVKPRVVFLLEDHDGYLYVGKLREMRARKKDVEGTIHRIELSSKTKYRK